MPIITNEDNNKEVENWIKSIGQSIIDRAKDISNDIDDVTSISIYATIKPNAILNLDITKNHIVEVKSKEV